MENRFICADDVAQELNVSSNTNQYNANIRFNFL